MAHGSTHGHVAVLALWPCKPNPHYVTSSTLCVQSLHHMHMLSVMTVLFYTLVEDVKTPAEDDSEPRQTLNRSRAQGDSTYEAHTE